MNALGYIDAPASRANLTDAIGRCAEHLRPILEAVRDHRVGALFVGQSDGPFRLPDASDRPAFVLIADDTDKAVGPGGFHAASVRRAIRACHSFVVVSSAPIKAIYGTSAAIVAINREHVMLVETRPEQELAWVALIQKLAPGKPLLISTVKGGHA